MKRRELLAWTATGAALAAVGLDPKPTQASRVVATYVHPSLSGSPTACGGTWSNDAFIVAAKNYRCGTRLRLTNPVNGATIVVRVTDHSPNSALDLSRHAFRNLAALSQGTVTVNVQVL